MRTLYTIGHSTRPIDEFLAILKAFDIKQLVDIRTIPKSRRNPQYGKENLKESLENAGIRYIYSKDLGGLRPSVKTGGNEAWENTSFRNYADYMQTDEFKEAVEELLGISQEEATVIMCAEAVPWRCHRRLVGDAMLVREVPVTDIFSEKKAEPHRLTPFASVDGLEVTYPKKPGNG